MPSSLKRRPTCPVTRRESEQLMDIFLNLPTTPTTKESTLNNYNNNFQNDSECHCGKERPMFMRSDSYRQATQVFHEVDSVDNMRFRKESYDPRKYVSLPIDKRPKVNNERNKPTSTLNRTNKPTSTSDKRNKLKRQKSGTVPSSDSDNHMSPPENRKKKSRFQRTKERIIFKLWKDKKRSEHKDKSVVARSLNSPQHEVVLEVETKKEHHKNARINKDNIEHVSKPTKNPVGSEKSTEEHSSARNQMAPSRAGRRFRTQVSREEITNMFEKILSSAEIREEPFTFPNGSQRNLERNDFNPVRDTSHADGIKNKKSSLSLDLVACTPKFTTASRVSTSLDKTETVLDEHGTKHTIYTHTTTLERTFSLEVDGPPDELDGSVQSPSADDKDKLLSDAKETTSNQDPLTPTEQERMIEDIARRLNRIADDCVQRMESGESQSGGAVAAPLLSPNSKSRKLANDLVTELRKEGDRLSRELDLPDSLLPIIMDMVKQITYDHFKKCVKKALCETIGWDQVAMYFYVSRAAIVMAGVGGQMAFRLKDMAVRYFHEEICPWIYDRGGLETMLTETDSEVD